MKRGGEGRRGGRGRSQRQGMELGRVRRKKGNIREEGRMRKQK